MLVGTLPVWAMVLIFSVVISFFIGLINPYVPKANLIRLEYYDKEDWSKPRPEVTIKERLSPGTVVVILFLVMLVADVLFLVDGVGPLAKSLGDGVFSTLAVIIGSFVVFVLVFIFDLLAYVTGLDLTAKRIKRHFERQYGAKIKRET